MATVHEKLIGTHNTCGCKSCEEGRFIKRVAGMLPEAESKELLGWYNVLRDRQEEQMMTRAWVQSELEEIVETVKKSEF